MVSNSKRLRNMKKQAIAAGMKVMYTDHLAGGAVKSQTIDHNDGGQDTGNGLIDADSITNPGTHHAKVMKKRFENKWWTDRALAAENKVIKEKLNEAPPPFGTRRNIGKLKQLFTIAESEQLEGGARRRNKSKRAKSKRNKSKRAKSKRAKSKRAKSKRAKTKRR